MRPSVQLYLRLLTRYLRPQLRQTLLLLLVLCANILLQLINPLLLRRFLDSALAGGSVELLPAWRCCSSALPPSNRSRP